jgi:two-component system sensor histidine kinase KdpD
MIGSATALRDLGQDLSEADRKELLDSITSEGERLNRYIQNLLDMTRLGHGTLKIERDWIGLDDILNAALRRTRDILRGVHVVRLVAPDLPLLYVHPALIEQVLVNVIENAARFSPGEGELRIEADVDANELRIRITDQGPGIPADQRKKVFDMFFTGGGSDSGRRGGGLGLAICAGMIGAHMGRIEALPGPGDRGTTIEIHLPIAEQPRPEESGA